jgi:hypothetical protein
VAPKIIERLDMELSPVRSSRRFYAHMEGSSIDVPSNTELSCVQCHKPYKTDARKAVRRICPECYQTLVDNSVIQDNWMENLQEGVFEDENVMRILLMSQIGKRI